MFAKARRNGDQKENGTRADRRFRFDVNSGIAQGFIIADGDHYAHRDEEENP
jgi:hypothetical protein